MRRPSAWLRTGSCSIERVATMTPLLTALLLSVSSATSADEEIPRLPGRQLFVDESWIAAIDGDAELRLHAPTPAGVALKFNAPWDGIVSGYVTVIHDEREANAGRAGYRMWYRGRPTTSRADGSEEAREVVCYAESQDGLHWRKPALGLHDIDSNSQNNVVMVGPPGVTHNFCPFLDRRPDVPDDEHYKGVGGTARTGLHGFVSADGLRWRSVSDEPLITSGAFDSQNVVFWSSREERYLCFLRTFREGVRWIARSTSEDFLHWTDPVDLDFGDAPAEHLYTNQIQPYFRAPHYDLGTPARFWPGRQALRDDQVAAIDLEGPQNYAGLRHGVSDAVLISSRGGTRFDRTFLESFVRPGIGDRTWVARSNYPALGFVPTSPSEMSLYVQRNYGQREHHLERLALRLDGFASMHAGYDGGRFTTRPFRFALPAPGPSAGEIATHRLWINASTSAGGSLRFELRDENGRPIPGHSLAECDPYLGDEIDGFVTWQHDSDVSSLSGRVLILHVELQDADLYSWVLR